MMTLREIQKEVDDWTRQFRPQYWPPLQIMARLSEENGEVAREINHLYGIKKKKTDEKDNNLGQELVDMIFTISCMANSHRIRMQNEWNRMMQEKLYKRDNERFRRK